MSICVSKYLYFNYDSETALYFDMSHDYTIIRNYFSRLQTSDIFTPPLGGRL